MRRYFAWALGAMALFSSCKMYDNLPEGDDKPALIIPKELAELGNIHIHTSGGEIVFFLPNLSKG